MLSKEDKQKFDALDENERTLDKFVQKLPVIVKYDSQIFIGKQQNAEIESTLLNQF